MNLKGERCNSTKCALVKRNYPPGIHGPKGRQKKTDYNAQLQEKQKAKKQYVLLEKQFRLTFEKARKETGNVGENLFKLLEMRLDNVIYRAGFAQSRSQARELIGHGHFKVNDKKVNIPSYTVRSGDIVGVAASSKRSKAFNNLGESLKKAAAPGWLNLNAGELSAKVLHNPGAEDMKAINFNPQVIVEFYSR